MSMNTRRWLVVLACVTASAAMSLGATGCSSRPEAQPTEEVSGGERVTLRFFRNPAAVPAVAMRDLDGRPLSSADWRGKVVIVNFWATWCPPCRAEIPDLVALQNKYRDRLLIIGVSQDEGSVEVVKQFVAAHQMNYPVVMMTPEIDQAFPGIRALPTSFILDRESRVVQRHVGLLNQVVTEQETRALAGLPVNASIEEIDRTAGAPGERGAGDGDSWRRSHATLARSAYGRAPEAEHRPVHMWMREHTRQMPHRRPQVHDEPTARSASRSGNRRAAITGS